MIDLKPCPFCGGEAHFERIGDRRQSTIISCEDCGACLENGETFNHGTSWNTRADATRISALEAENARLREALNSIHNWLVCYPIVGDADMCSSIPDMEETARAALGDDHD
jgi:Lar family restriction alleviation protein